MGLGPREVTRRRWRRVELPTGDGEFDRRLRRLVDAHALASTRGDGHVGAAMLVGAGRRRLWEALGLLEDLDPDLHVDDAHELVVSLDEVEAMRMPPPSGCPHPTSHGRRRRSVDRSGRSALERSASASVQLRLAIDDLDADHEAIGRWATPPRERGRGPRRRRRGPL